MAASRGSQSYLVWLRDLFKEKSHATEVQLYGHLCIRFLSFPLLLQSQVHMAKQVWPTECPLELRTKTCNLVITIIVRHELGLDRPVSVSSLRRSSKSFSSVRLCCTSNWLWMWNWVSECI